MKVCFCGLGSIGKRHVKNLLAMAREFEIDVEIHALRKTAGILDHRIKGAIAKEITDVNQLDRDYDIAFITNPTNLHYDTMETMADRTRHMFIEKPIFDDREYHISALHLNRDGIYYVAGPLRHSGVIQTMKEIIENEKVCCVRAICSSYLPDWRPDTDYRRSYSARKARGGGVAVDLIHEWDYLTFLFGFPREVYHICGTYSQLEIDSDDTAVYIADYKDKVVELHLDYFGRVERREVEIFTETGTIVGDFINHTISFTDGRKNIYFQEDKNDIYLKEMRWFLDHIVKNQSLNNMEDCYSILKIALGKGIQ